MPNVIIYTTGYCPYCYQAKDLLDNKNIQYQEIRIDSDPARRAEMIQKSQRRTVPQIFINGHHVGGCDDLYALERQGRLDKLLED